MNLHVTILTIVTTFLFQGYNCQLESCSTPGFTLSSDESYCFAYSALSREVHLHSILCHTYGAKLVKIEDANKESLVEEYLKEKGVNDEAEIFIGLTNMLNDPKVWLWYGGNITDYTNWKKDEPQIDDRDNCVLMRAGNPNYKWRAASCLTGAFAICEREATDADLT